VENGKASADFESLLQYGSNMSERRPVLQGLPFFSPTAPEDRGPTKQVRACIFLVSTRYVY
jgi:hypothetical protein